jgi:hypothetical protein
MRILASFLLINALAFAQNLTEFGAAAAGSALGGASGKPISDGLTAIFSKVGQAPAKAAVTETTKEKEPQEEPKKVAPGSSGAPNSDPGGVPPPPPARASKRSAPAPVAVAQYVAPVEVTRLSTLADVAPVLPPPPVMSPEDFRSVSTGMTRADVLKFGVPDSKITMFEDGHLVELYSYHQNGQKFGGLRLTDGVVSSIQ